ncbi:MAG: YfhO family protein [Pirellulaceae bacterium]|nr:YfhO family protein [Pirellulaceae bacterium]
MVSSRMEVCLPRYRKLLLTAALLGPWLFCFGPVLVGARSFAFRDTAHFYEPRFEWIQQQWSQGSVPLWNMREGFGFPTLADGSSSVFYPGKLLFFLPIDFRLLFGWYVALHALAAMLAAAWAARRWGLSPESSAAAGLVYALSGVVLFQTANVVFLVGSAWLPVALYAVDAVMRTGSHRWIVTLAVSLAMMVLGGDAQLAYHVGIAAVVLGWVRWRQRNRPSDDERQAATPNSRLAGLWGCAAASLLAAGLAAVQIAPTWEWAQSSERQSYAAPRNIYEWIADGPSVGSLSTGLVAEPQAGHHRSLYHFSVGPWRWIEWAWPNVSGRMSPTNQRWIQIVAAEGRVWTPSLYAGTLAILLAVFGGWIHRREDTFARWLTLLILLSLLAACGWFGVGWLIHESARLLGRQPIDIGPATGGVYWLLVSVLPKYVMFRYPAKWLTFTALGIAILAARGLDRAGGSRSSWPVRLCLTIAGFSLLLAVATWLFRGSLADHFSSLPADRYYGPFDTRGAINALLFSFSQAALVMGVAATLLRRAQDDAAESASWSRLAVVWLIAVDLCLANHWLVVTAPSDRNSVDAAPVAVSADENERFFRASRHRWTPPEWRELASPQRTSEIASWERDTLFPKHHLSTGLAQIESYNSINPLATRLLFERARKWGVRRSDGVREPDPRLLNRLGVTCYALPPSYDIEAGLPSAEPIDNTWRGRCRWWKVTPTIPPAWFVRSFERHPRPALSELIAWRNHIDHVFFPGGSQRNLVDSAVVDERFPDFHLEPAAGFGLVDMVRTDQRIQLNTENDHAGLLVIPAQHHRSWRAKIIREGRSERVAIHVVNGFMMAIKTPPGRNEVVLTYRPYAFYAGALISLATWLSLVVAGLRRRLWRSQI